MVQLISNRVKLCIKEWEVPKTAVGKTRPNLTEYTLD